jgi:hypothetical protein
MKAKEATYTPKPWRNNDSYDSVLGADGEVICHTFGAVDPVDRLNAILIASAPDMLTVLQEIAWHTKGVPADSFHWSALFGEEGGRKVKAGILSAIAKATGKEMNDSDKSLTLAPPFV